MTRAFRGPTAVRAALLDAATDLWAAQADPSVRAIAARAGVNHGLVHHYWGTKSELRAAVIQSLTTQLRGIISGASARTLRAMVAALERSHHDDPRRLRIIARVLLDDDPLADRLGLFGGERSPKADCPPASAEHRRIVAEGLAMALGLVVFRSWAKELVDPP